MATISLIWVNVSQPTVAQGAPTIVGVTSSGAGAIYNFASSVWLILPMVTT